MSFLLRAAAAMLLTVGLLPSGPASAAGTGPTAIRWRYSSCVQASLSGLQPDTRLDYFVVTGTAVECAAPTATDLPVGFGLVMYRGRASLPGRLQGYNVRVFPTPQATGWQPTPIAFGALAVDRTPGTHGVCVTAGPITLDPQMPLYYQGIRVACARVTVTGSQATGYSATMEPLATNDPLVSSPVSERSSYTGSASPEPSSGGGGGNGFCGTCF